MQLAPAQFLLTSKDNKELGSHCMERNEPGFRDAVKDGHEVIVGGKAFGCGSSRQEAVQALLGKTGSISSSSSSSSPHFLPNQSRPSNEKQDIYTKHTNIHLTGVGAKCVIAKSFAFIFARNMPSLGLLGFTIADERFYELAGTGAAIEIDLDQNVLRVGGEAFPFALSALEKRLTEIGGMTNAFSRFGKRIYDVLAGGAVAKAVPRPLAAEGAMSW